MSDKKPEMKLENVDAETLKAWAEAKIITHARYVEEMERRAKK